MFKAKYIFETKKTKFFRYLTNATLIIGAFFFIYLISGYFFILSSQNENNKSQETFYKSSPDLIAVFTGAAGRIPYAIKLAKKYKQSHVFITGVYSKNNVNTLLNPLTLNDDFNSNLLEIDYLARNTVENSMATLRYLRANQQFRRVLIISHDYHLLRIKTIITKMTSKDDPYEFYYSGVKSDYGKTKYLRILYKEVYKWIRTSAFLMVWNSDSELPI